MTAQELIAIYPIMNPEAMQAIVIVPYSAELVIQWGNAHTMYECFVFGKPLIQQVSGTLESSTGTLCFDFGPWLPNGGAAKAIADVQANLIEARGTLIDTIPMRDTVISVLTDPEIMARPHCVLTWWMCTADCGYCCLGFEDLDILREIDYKAFNRLESIPREGAIYKVSQLPDVTPTPQPSEAMIEAMRNLNIRSVRTGLSININNINQAAAAVTATDTGFDDDFNSSLNDRFRDIRDRYHDSDSDGGHSSSYSSSSFGSDRTITYLYNSSPLYPNPLPLHLTLLNTYY